jgi:S1-C subfamily serine protease
MRFRVLGTWGLGIGAVLCAMTNAHASLVKSEGSPPVIMPNTLLVEAGERVGPGTDAPEKGEKGKTARPVANFKQSPSTCSAVAVKVPHQGTRIVTARHCADHRMVEVLDEDHHVSPIQQVDAAGEVDLSVLEVAGKLPWPGLEMGSSAAVTIGDRLCAWRMRRGPSGIEHERICAKVARRDERAGADPLLVMNHPYPAGTSGSALVDREGRVVGIVVASTGLSGIAEPIEGVLKLPPPPKVAATETNQE